MSNTFPDFGRVCLRRAQATKSQVRSFASTTRRRRNGPIAAFEKTDNSELDGLLDKLRNTVFLPAHLRTPQKHLVYRKYWQKYLTGEESVKVELPIVPAAHIGYKHKEDAPKEDFTLKPLDRVRDEPRHAASFNRILDLISDGSNDHSKGWDMIPGLLREWHLSGRKIQPHQVEKLVRRAARQCKLPMIINCFEHVEDNDFRLSNFDIAWKMISGAHEELGKEGGVDSAMKISNKTLDLLEDPRHQAVRPRSAVTPDFKQRPEVHGAILALLALQRMEYLSSRNFERRPVKGQYRYRESDAVASSDTTPGTARAPEAAKKVDSDARATIHERHTKQERNFRDPVTQIKPFPAVGRNYLDQMEERAVSLLRDMGNGQRDFGDSLSEILNGFELWMPTWFGIQLATRILPRGSPLRPELLKACEEQVDPLVTSFVEELLKRREAAVKSETPFSAETRIQRALDRWNSYPKYFGNAEDFFRLKKKNPAPESKES